MPPASTTTVLAPDRSLLLDVAEDDLKVVAGKTYGDDDLAGATSRSPDVVAVVTADGFGKPVLFTEEVYGPRFTVVGGEDAGAPTDAAADEPAQEVLRRFFPPL